MASLLNCSMRSGSVVVTFLETLADEVPGVGL